MYVYVVKMMDVSDFMLSNDLQISAPSCYTASCFFYQNPKLP